VLKLRAVANLALVASATLMPSRAALRRSRLPRADPGMRTSTRIVAVAAALWLIAVPTARAAFPGGNGLVVSGLEAPRPTEVDLIDPDTGAAERLTSGWLPSWGS
jgi:hypothetical protein